MASFRIPLVWQMYGHVDVDAETLEEAIEYAEQHIDEIPLTDMEWISGSDMLDKNNCEFAE